MRVDVQRRDAFVPRAQPRRRDGRDVHHAVPGSDVGGGVVPGRPAESVGGTIAPKHRVGGGDRAIGGATAGAPAVRTDRGGGVAHVPARAAHDAVGIPRDRRARENVRHHLGAGIVQLLPFVPRGFEERQQARRVHRLEGRAVRLGWCLGRQRQLVQPGQQQARALGLFGVAQDAPVGQAKDRVMGLGLGGVEASHGRVSSSISRNWAVTTSRATSMW